MFLRRVEPIVRSRHPWTLQLLLMIVFTAVLKFYEALTRQRMELH